MDKNSEAFKLPIKEGKARILIRFEDIKCEVENSAPDFIEPVQDEIRLKIDLPRDSKINIKKFEKSFLLKIKKTKTKLSEITLEFADTDVWFDINIDQVKDIWVAELNFSIESKNSRYLAYYIKELNHQFEWLQPDLQSGEVKTMSVSKKSYTVPKFSGKETFSATEVIRCADMLNRAINKIDLRVGGAYVKFNTDKGKLEPLIIGIANQLGYRIETLSVDTIAALNAQDKSVSHSIYLADKAN